MAEFFFGMVGVSLIEWIAVACGLANVLLIIRRSIWNYPFGFAMVVLYFFIFWQFKLYSEAFLQVYFFVIQFYGLWNWLQGQAQDGRVLVATLPRKTFAVYMAITVVAWILISGAMDKFTDAAAPRWDAAVAALSVVAQFLMSRRHLESWLLWIAVDILAIGLFFTRDLVPTAALYAVFLVLAITGYLQWRNAPRSA